MTTHQSIPIRSFDELSKVKDVKPSPDSKIENLIIDYDDLSYIRLMKSFDPSSTLLYGEKEFNKKIDLETYYFGDRLRKEYENNPDPKVNSLNTADISDGELKDNLCNTPFHLRFYFPKSVILRREAKVKHLVIMFNGMDETGEYLLYDTLGEYFASKGMGAVLIPTPLHLNRRIIRGGRPQTPTRIAINKHNPKEGEGINPRLFYYSFVRSWFELQKLKCKITNIAENGTNYWDQAADLYNDPSFLTDKRFYESYFGEHTDKSGTFKQNKEIKFTLLGYSLGGLRALSFFLNDTNSDNKEKSKFDSCITINTCPKLEKARTKALSIIDQDWKDLMKIAENFITNEEHLETNTKLRELNTIFKNLYFPEENEDGNGNNNEKRYNIEPAFADKLRNNLNRYLAIASGSDDIVDPSQIDLIAPKNKSIHKLTIAGVNHKPESDPDWQDLLPRVESNMLEFIQSCNELHYTKNEILSQLAVIFFNLDVAILTKLFTLASKPDSATDCQKELEAHLINDFTNNEMEELITSISTCFPNINIDMRLRFLKYYYLSKAFFPHFVQTIAKLYESISKRTEKGEKEKLCSSDIIFEMIKLYKKKEETSSPYCQLFGSCEQILSPLRTEYRQYIEQKEMLTEMENHTLPFNHLIQRLDKIGITEGELKNWIKYGDK